MILYLSGPISDDPGYKRKFDAAESHLSTWKGHIVLNPAVLPVGLNEYDDYMAIGFAMLEAADGIVMLGGWKRSPGAREELKAAICRGKMIFFGVESVPFMDD